jgi:myosin-1
LGRDVSFCRANGLDATIQGVDDLVLLPKVADDAITTNLGKRYGADQIYTYIGTTLVAVNPYQKLPALYTPEKVALYRGQGQQIANPPHIFAVAEEMFQNLLSDEESQAVIISGESGAGKTESAKLILGYIAAASGKGSEVVENVKRIILDSNPLLEAFGNAKTLRNENSSRFGKCGLSSNSFFSF